MLEKETHIYDNIRLSKEEFDFLVRDSASWRNGVCIESQRLMTKLFVNSEPFSSNDRLLEFCRNRQKLIEFHYPRINTSERTIRARVNSVMADFHDLEFKGKTALLILVSEINDL